MTDVRKLAEQIQWLVDREQIRDVMTRYVRGVDRVDPDLIRGTYHEDSTDEHGFTVVTGWEFADQKWRSNPLRTSSSHLIGIPHIELDGDVAYVETYFIGHQRHGIPMDQLVSGSTATESTADHVSLLVGRYVDRFEKRDGEWKVKSRKVVMDTAEEYVEASPHPLFDSFINGQTFPDDPVYHPKD